MLQRRRKFSTLAAAACLGLAAASQAGVQGELSLDKAAQRRLSIVTQLPSSQADSWLAARVVADPSRRWRAMADQAGAIEPPESGFPKPGDRVEAGQILAWLRPSLTEPELRDLQAQRRVVQRDHDLAETQLKRFDIDVAQAIDVRLPTPSIQIVADYQGAQARGAALDEVLNGRIAVRVPVSGVLLENRVQSQKIAAAGDNLFEGSGAAAVAVELIAPQDKSAATALLRVGDQLQPQVLQRLSASYDPALRAWRLLYGAQDASQAADLLPGEPVSLRLVLTQSPLSLPRSSVFRHDNQTLVWVHQNAEHFAARPVQLGAAEGSRQIVLAGLSKQDRVVVDAAALIRVGVKQ